MRTLSHSRVAVNDETRRWVEPARDGVFEESGVFFVSTRYGGQDLVRLVKSSVHPALANFEKGKEGIRPDQATLSLARTLIEVATRRASNPDIHVDFEGSLSFDLRLHNGHWLLADLFIDGQLDVSVYDTAAKEWVVNWPRATESQFKSIF